MISTIWTELAFVRIRAAGIALIIAALVAACGGGGGGGGGSSAPAPQTFTIGVAVSGLTGSGLVLQDNGGDNLTVTADGSFTFATAIASGGAYAVTVSTQPSSPAQVCSVASGSGTVGSANVTNVTVSCATSPTYTIGGTVTGLSGSGLSLQNNAGDSLAVSANGTFTFSTPVASGAAYAVTVKSPPVNPSQNCAVMSGSGTVGTSNVTTVSVVCSTSMFVLSGTVSGLSGSGLVLQTNGANNVSVTSNGSYSLAMLGSGTAYTVSVKTQPSSPAQTCAVGNGSGTITSANVSNVTIACTTNPYSVGGSVSGLSGTGLVIQTNGANNVSVTSSGNYTFATLNSGVAYTVSVLTQPTSPAQTCVVSNGAGTVGVANVTNVSIACTTNGFTVGGTVSGLAGSGLVVQTNGANSFPVAHNGTYAFATLNPNTAFTVSVLTQPTSPTQTCVVGNGTGTVTTMNITSVTITCTTKYTIGGTITGLTGTGLVLQDNAGDNLTVAAHATSFTFATPLASGAAYAVTVHTQPTSPAQFCTVTSGSGTMPASNVTSVALSCLNVGRFVFVTNETDSGAGATGDVSAYTINPATGALTQVTGSPYAAGTKPSQVVVDPSGLYVYVSNAKSRNLTPYAINTTTGALTAGANFQTNITAPESITAAPNGEYLFTGGYNGAASTGAVDSYGLSAGVIQNSVPNSPFTSNAAPFGMAVDPTSSYLFVTNNSHAYLWVYTIASDGELNAPFGSQTTGNQPYGVVVYPGSVVAGGYVYTANTYDGTVSGFSYDSTTALTALSGSPYSVGNSPHGVAIDPLGRFLFVTNTGDNTVSSFTINATTGVLGSVGPAVATGNLNGVTNPAPIGVVVDPSGQYVYVANSGDGSVSLFTISASGVLTLRGSFASGTDGSGADSIELAVE